MGNLLINLSFVGKKPTGLATYAINLIPHISIVPQTLLASTTFQAHHTQFKGNYYTIPANLTPEQGKLGHLQRLGWTQFQIPQLYRKLEASLLFSPIPEAPLLRNCRSIVTMHDLIPLRFPSKTSPLTYYCRYYIPQVLKQAKHIICNSQATAQDVIDFFGIPARKLTPIPLAHDASHFRVLDLSDRPAPSRPYFFYVGRHDPYKNLHRIVAAFAQLSQNSDYELWIAGTADPRYTPLLQTQAQELGIADRVKFLDYVSYTELPVLLNQAIALVYPSLWEGFGFPVLEAMACGTPVITSNLSSLPEVAGDAAVLVNPYSETEIAAAMQQIITDDQARSHLQRAGLDRASQFSWEITGQLTSQILQQYL